jgi:hypothetical protein
VQGKMKKLHFFVLLTFCMIVFHAKGQSSVGVKADMNISGLLTSPAANLKSSMKAGGSAGFFYKYTRFENRAIQADMALNYHTSEIFNRDTGETADYRYLGIEIPLYLIIQADMEEGLFYLGVGPYLSFGLYSHFKSDIRSINLYDKEKSNIHRLDFGPGLIIGYEMKCNLQFNFNYQLGLRNMVGDGFENVDLISQLVGLVVGYRF